MLIQLLILAVGSQAFSFRNPEEPCEKWKNHKNIRLVHGEDDCGKVKINREISSRIINGKDAERGSSPWMALVRVWHDKKQQRHQAICGGSIINDRYVLTAAHCIYNKINPNISVAVGVYDKSCSDLPVKCDPLVRKYPVRRSILHPKYDSLTLKNDIALLRLKRSISFESPYFNYICLPTSCKLANDSYFKSNVTVAGWGLMENLTRATVLQEAFFSVKPCLPYTRPGLRQAVGVTEAEICTDMVNARTCFGDSGGPLVYKTEDRFVQVGVMSSSPSNCKYKVDGVLTYSRVSSHMDWILDSLKP